MHSIIRTAAVADVVVTGARAAATAAAVFLVIIDVDYLGKGCPELITKRQEMIDFTRRTDQLRVVEGPKRLRLVGRARCLMNMKLPSPPSHGDKGCPSAQIDGEFMLLYLHMLDPREHNTLLPPACTNSCHFAGGQLSVKENLLHRGHRTIQEEDIKGDKNGQKHERIEGKFVVEPGQEPSINANQSESAHEKHKDQSPIVHQSQPEVVHIFLLQGDGGSGACWRRVRVIGASSSLSLSLQG